MSITSYAQNFEDVMLWRALGHIERGLYIDIGAQDPIIDSVSLAFHEHGWQGIHVEPTAHYAELLRQQRPGDTVIQAAVGQDSAVLQFFEIPDTGISTADAVIAAQHRERGFNVYEITVPCIPLAAILKICAEQEIQWLKIDVEGFEQQVLSSWGTSAARPWIVVVESTLPLTQIETHQSWESILIGHGYTSVYFDGLNRYYVSDTHPELKAAFASPPNVFDGFSLNGTASAPFHKLIEARYQEKISEAEKHLAELALSQSEQESALRGEHADREQTLYQKLKVFQEQLNRQQQERAACEQTLHEQNSHLRQQVRREQEISTQLLTFQQKSVQERNEMASRQNEKERALYKLHADRERYLIQQCQAGQQLLQDKQQEWAQREQVLAHQISLAQRALESHLRHHALRERDMTAQFYDKLQAEQKIWKNLQQELTTLQIEMATTRSSLSWRLTAPLRVVTSFFLKPAEILIEPPLAAPVLNSQAESAHPGNQEFKSNHSFSGNLSMTSDHPIKTSRSNSSRPAPSLKALLQLHDSQFVECAYLTLLRRQPDAEGLNYYLGRIRGGVSKIQILGQLLNSPEARVNGFKLPGLIQAVKREKLSRLPFFGALVKQFIVVDGHWEFEMRIRSIEQQIFLLDQKSGFQYSHLEHSLENLRKLIEFKNEQNHSAIHNNSQTPTAEPVKLTIQKEDREPQSIFARVIEIQKDSVADVIGQLAEILNDSQEARQLSIRR